MIIPHLGTIATIRNGSGGGGGLIPSQSFAMQLSTAVNFNPADSTTYYIGNATVGTGVTISQPRIYVQKKCILKKVYINSTQSVTATSENETLSIVVNETTEYQITATFKHDQANVNTGNNTAMSIPLNPGDYFCVKRVTPAWVTNPTSVRFQMSFWCDCSPTSSTGSYLLQCGVANIVFSASTTYYLHDDQGSTSSSPARIYIPANGTITSAGIYARAGVVSSAETFTYAIRLNDTTDYVITSTATLNALSNTFSNASMSVPVSAGDYISLKLIGPARGTTPTASHRFSFVIDR